MKRNVLDTLRRGLDSALANWQLFLLRLAGTIVIWIVVFTGIVAAVIPVIGMVVSGAALSGILGRGWDPERASEIFQRLIDVFIGHLWIIPYIFVIAVVLVVAVVAIESFVLAGVARVFADADRAAGANPPLRQRFATFSMGRFLQGAREKWLSIFAIVNAVWGLIGTIALLPVLAGAIVVLIAVTSKTPVLACGTCFFFAIAILLMIVGGIVGAVWQMKAVALCVARNWDAPTSLRESWREIKPDLGRHLAVAAIVYAILFGGTGMISSISFAFNAASQNRAPLMIAFAPFRIALSFASTIFSILVTNWFMACYIALTNDR